jgi:hypothetical protein
MSTPIQGLRGSGQFDTTFRPRNYRELFTLLEPNGNSPLNALLSMGQSESTNDPAFRNFRDELPERRMKVNGAVTSTGTGSETITLDADNENKFAISGSIVVNGATGEVMHVTSDTSGTSLVVTRNVGGTAHAIADDAELFIAGFAAQEGADTPTAVSFDAVMVENFCQIFRTSFSVTGTMNSTYLRTGDKQDEARVKALKMHMSDIERAMFFGKKDEDNASSAQPRRFTGGLMTSLTNKFDVGTASSSAINAADGILTEEEFDLALTETIFKFGSNSKIAFVGAKVANHLQQFGKDRWQPTQVEGAYGVNLTRYSTFAGDLMVHLHPQFRQIPGMDTAMVIVDFPYLSYRYLEGRDTQLLEGRQNPGADTEVSEYLTEAGLELMQDSVHAVIEGWSARKA